MTKYLVLYRSTMSNREMMAKSTPAQMQASMDEWGVWTKKAGTAVLDLGSPVGTTTVLKGTASGGFFGGYSIVQAESLDAARRLFDAHPHLGAPGASIELLELLSMPGM